MIIGDGIKTAAASLIHLYSFSCDLAYNVFNTGFSVPGKKIYNNKLTHLSFVRSKITKSNVRLSTMSCKWSISSKKLSLFNVMTK